MSHTNSLFKAIHNNDSKKIKYYISNNPEFMTQTDSQNNTPLHLAVKLSHEALQNNNVELAKKYQKISHFIVLKSDSKTLNTPNKDGYKVTDSFQTRMQSAGATKRKSKRKLKRKSKRKSKSSEQKTNEHKKMLSELGLELDL